MQKDDTSQFNMPMWQQRKSVGWLDRFLSKYQPPYDRDLYSSMFIEDCSQLVPLKDAANSNRYFKVDANHRDISDALISAMGDERYSVNADEAIQSFLESVTKSCLTYGRAVYFLHSTPDQYGRPKFRLVNYSHHNFFKLFGQWYQYVGQSNTNLCPFAILTKLGFREVNPNRVLEIRLRNPENRTLLKTMRQLKEFGKLRTPKIDQFLPTISLENPKAPRSYFDYEDFRKKSDLAFFSLVKDVGWSGRDHTNEYQSEFLACQRMLRFKAFRISIRDMILEQMGPKISRMISAVEREFRIEFSADQLAGLDDVERKSKDLFKGKVGFTKIVDFVFNA